MSFASEYIDLTRKALTTDRMDGRHAYPNVRPAFAKTRTEWEDVDVFERDMDICSAEAIEYKNDINWYVLYAQKPLDN